MSAILLAILSAILDDMIINILVYDMISVQTICDRQKPKYIHKHNVNRYNWHILDAMMRQLYVFT